MTDTRSFAQRLVATLFNSLMIYLFLTAVLLCRSVLAYDTPSEAESVLIKRCIECHNSVDHSGELDLTRLESLKSGGSSGQVIVAGDSASSPLVKKLRQGAMPPEKNGKSQKLDEVEIAAIEKWINAGLPWQSGRVLDLYDRTTDIRAGRDWWSLQSIRHISLLNDLGQQPILDDIPCNNAIDHFIRSRLQEHNLTPAKPAEQRKLLRRLYMDLIGIPPSADEIEAFEQDESPNAYEHRVDALLASPQFGVRWGRYWLDVVRYADTNGYERDAEKKFAWRYRDWVVQSFNHDMPYDTFVLHQLAGDEVDGRDESSVIATGFLRLGTWDDEPNDTVEYQYDRLEDLVHATSTAFLGLTVKCARCHDHKFDPLYQTDYYRVAAVFWPGPVAHRDRALNGGPSRDELEFDVLGWTDITKSPKPLHALKKGNVHAPLQQVDAGPISSFAQFNMNYGWDASISSANPKTTGRRLQFAKWLTHPEHPLTARVIVNRLWQHLLGEGLVRTPDNFGFNGQPPTHPQLLDWLANELVLQNWQLKPIIKMIVESATYRQSSNHPLFREHAQIDSGNLYLWHAHSRRMDAEALRDSILNACGQIQMSLGGPSFKAPISDEALEGLSMKGQAYKASEFSETTRRSLYMYHKRSLLVPFMTTFDLCDSTVPTGRRESTIVPTQALAMLNGEWSHKLCRSLANQIVSSGLSRTAQIRLVWRTILGRSPTDQESEDARNYLQKQCQLKETENTSKSLEGLDSIESFAVASLCHVLINTNEFAYLD